MNPKFKEMLSKKKDLSPNEKHAKMGVLKDLKHSLADEAGSRMDGLKKVSVMSNSPEGLQHGLEKAKELAEQEPDADDVAKLSDGGQVDPMQSAQDSMRKAFGGKYSEGGDVSPEEAELDEAHESAEDEAKEPDEFEGLNIEELKEKIRQLMHNGKAMGIK